MKYYTKPQYIILSLIKANIVYKTLRTNCHKLCAYNINELFYKLFCMRERKSSFPARFVIHLQYPKVYGTPV